MLSQKTTANLQERIQAVRQGLPYESTLKDLQETLELSLSELSELSGIPERTLARRKKEGKLQGGPESERVERVQRIIEQAIELFEGDKKEALRWLRSPVHALYNQTPLEIAKTEIGAREVENLIIRLEHGVF